MGTYLVFHLSDWSQVQQCHLVLNGIEKVPRSDVPPKVILQRINNTSTSRLLPTEGNCFLYAVLTVPSMSTVSSWLTTK